MYDHILKVHGQYLAKEQALPKNTSADGNGQEQDYSGSLGGVEILAEVAGDIALADGKALTVTLAHADEGGGFSELGEVCSLTASGATTVAAGTVLGRFIPPTDTKARTKAVIATTDGAAVGSLNVYPHYLAR